MEILPEGISTYSPAMDSLISTITFFVLFWFILSFGVLIFFVVKYRKKENIKAGYITGQGWGQLKWVMIPVIIVALCDFYIDHETVKVWNKIEGTPPKADVRVKITGQKWRWSFTYPGLDGKLGTADDVTIDGQSEPLHVPVNKKIVFDLVALDVLHSFWVKEIRLKQDAIPGRTITRWFEATKKGKYELACAELCGILHAKMKSDILVESFADYNKYLTRIYYPKKTK